MKKIISLLLSVFIILSSFSISAVSAKEINKVFVGNSYTGNTGECSWEFNENTGTLSISGKGEMEDGYNDGIDHFYSSWQEYASKIKKVTLSEGITHIGDYSFYKCTKLKSITIPKSVTSIGNCAFYSCTSLTSITLPDSITSIESNAFNKTSYYNNNANWNNKVLYIGKYLIEAKPTISNNYTVKNGTKVIASFAFDECSNLTSIVIPNSVISIGQGAFLCCSGLTNIKIPNSVTKIEFHTFGSCTNLKSITIPNSITVISDWAFRECKSLKSITIPNGITSIGDEIFSNCTSLTSITIPDSVTSIGVGAFYNTGYYNDKNNWDNGVFYVENCLISANDVNGDYNIKEGTKLIANRAFLDCTSLTSITIPNSVITIGECAFEGCINIKNITIPDSVTSIEEQAFRDCSSLTGITIPDSVTSIADYAFDGCTRLTSIIIPSSVTSISKNAFDNTGYYNDKNNWDNGALYINNYLIDAKNVNDSYVIKDGTKVIAAYAFSDCENLTSITIPEGVTSISEDAFSYCTSLINITIPNSVTSIKICAFYKCYSLNDVYYLGTREQWNKIKIEKNNEQLLEANVHFLSIEPTAKKVTKVTLNKKSVALVKGKSVVVKATVSPSNATNKKLKWTTSNSKVATVNASGKITAKGKGVATIKATALDGSKKYATLKVTVRQPVTSVKLNKTSATLKVKGKTNQKSVTLKVNVLPKNANNKAVTWKSSNTKVATVNSKGKVIAKKKGTCYITATAKDGSKKSAKCRITVK